MSTTKYTVLYHSLGIPLKYNNPPPRAESLESLQFGKVNRPTVS